MKYICYSFLSAALCVLSACSDDPKKDEPDSTDGPSTEESEQQQEPEEPQSPEIVYEPFQIVGQMSINTVGGAPITSKEDYVDCTIKFTHPSGGDDWAITNAEAGIRGRGNSTWEWYPKKPYRIKFAKKQSLMGLPKAKSWVLLAEYRDPTDLMNAYVFELGQLLGMPFTNHNRYVELTLNGRSQGLYHLTEQVQQGGEGRVNIDEKEGILMQFDRDDGPELAPSASDNFWSQVYGMPVCVKNPENLSADGLKAISQELAVLENAIKAKDYTKVDELLDIPSMIDFLIIQELVYNVELDAPRSMYCHRGVGGKWTMGPLWDFDGGFDFSWTDMTKSHTYFMDYRPLVMGTSPASHTGTQYDVPGFFTDLFRVQQFTQAYKARWKQVHALMPEAWKATEAYYNANLEAWQREQQLWPIGKDAATEIGQMHSWLDNRASFLDQVISTYP